MKEEQETEEGSRGDPGFPKQTESADMRVEEGTKEEMRQNSLAERRWASGEC